MIETVFPNFNVEAFQCVADIMMSKVYLRDSTGHPKIIALAVAIVPNFWVLDPTTMFRASFS